MEAGYSELRGLRKLRGILQEIGPCVVAFSGGVDSTFLLRVAHDVLGDGVTAVIAVSPSLPRAEREEALTLAELIGARHLVVSTREMDEPAYLRNDALRCYYCKRELFSVLGPIAERFGDRAVLYGAITDDLGDDRPGMAAAREAGVRAPLIEAGLSKKMIRALSRRLGLPTWDKPAMACLASRIPRSTEITAEALGLVEGAEAAVRALGFRQVRVRYRGRSARVEVDQQGLRLLQAPDLRRQLIEAVKRSGFETVEIDPAGYRSAGSQPPSRGAGDGPLQTAGRRPGSRPSPPGRRSGSADLHADE
jgi:uncharacterized protein